MILLLNISETCAETVSYPIRYGDLCCDYAARTFVQNTEAAKEQTLAKPAYKQETRLIKYSEFRIKDSMNDQANLP